jgi:hypothetical protein
MAPGGRLEVLRDFGHEIQVKAPRAVVAVHLQHPPWIIWVGVHQIRGCDVHGVDQPQ